VSTHLHTLHTLCVYATAIGCLILNIPIVYDDDDDDDNDNAVCTDRIHPGVDSDVRCVGWSYLCRHTCHYSSTFIWHHPRTTSRQRLLSCRLYLLHHSTSSLWGA